MAAAQPFAKRRRQVLNVGVTPADYELTCELVLKAARDRRPLTVTALAVHGVMTGALDLEHCRRLNALDLVVPDGQPVRWALNLLYRARLSQRVYGPELMLRLCRLAEAEGLAVGFYGSRQDVLDDLRANLLVQFPRLQIVIMEPSRFRRVGPKEQASIATSLAASGAKLVFVGLGCPRQEVWLYEHRWLLNMPLLAVGAAFDFHAKRLPQAPDWMQRRGLEWLFRLGCEPRRLWRRYLMLNPIYIVMLLLQATRVLRFEKPSNLPPPKYEGYG